jgi:hypothetical protein
MAAKQTPEKSLSLTPRSPQVLLHCLKPAHEKAALVPPFPTAKQPTAPGTVSISHNRLDKKTRKAKEILAKENKKAVQSRQKEILTQQLINRLGR